MPYTIQLYPEELGVCPVPGVGDVFVVVEVDEDVADLHFGPCVFVGLRRLTSGSSRLLPGVQADALTPGELSVECGDEDEQVFEGAMVVMWREVIQDLLKRLDELETAVKEAQRDLQFYARTTNRYKFRSAVAILEHVTGRGRREC